MINYLLLSIVEYTTVGKMADDVKLQNPQSGISTANVLDLQMCMSFKNKGRAVAYLNIFGSISVAHVSLI